MNSKIILCKNIKMDREYVNVLSYTESQILELCNQNKIVSAENFSFIRSNKTIQVPFSYGQCLQANYIAFQNPDYSNKWMFAWIDEVIYKGNLNTEISYTLDSWSTWYSKLNVKPCFIQREHANSDEIGENTIPENLDVGDVVQEFVTEDISLSEYYWVAVQSAWQPLENSDGTELLDKNKGIQFNGVTVYNKQVFGTPILLFRVNEINDLLNLSYYILRTNYDGHIADINNIFIVPSALIDESKLELHNAKLKPLDTEYPFSFYTLKMTDTVESIEFEIDKITSFGDYNCKNRKCYCYPYNYLLVSNNIGNVNIYKYEDFYDSDKAKFILDLAISIGVSGKLTPKDYKRMSRNDDESIPLGKYPTCSWSSDAFTNWLTQQAVNESFGMALGIFGASSQYASDINKVNTNNQKVLDSGKGDMMSTTGANISLGMNIAGTVAKQIGNFYTGALMPNIQGGQNTGDVTWASKRNTFSFRCMRAKTEYLKIIDDYFSRFRICNK